MTNISKNAAPPIFVALDVPTRNEAVELARKLRGEVGGFKIGLELFCAAGPEIVREIGASETFLDLKFHDIPNTVRGVSRVAARLGATMFNVHCLGGLEMMRAAVEASREESASTRVIGVTILTSHDAASLAKIGLHEEPQRAVSRLALLAREAGLDGVVCSPQEIAAVRRACGQDFLIVTPGIRPQSAARADDQKRVLAPREALEAGANWLVVGRPITAAPDVVQAARDILK